MDLGPIKMVDLTAFPNAESSPRKVIQAQMNMGKAAVLFDATYPMALQAEVEKKQIDTTILQTTQAKALVIAHQIEEMAKNRDWQWAGLYVRLRTTVQDASDGFYFMTAADVSESLLFGGDEQDYTASGVAVAKPRLDLDLRAVLKPLVGIYVDQKAVPNDANLGGVAMMAVPGGIGAQYPAATWTVATADGTQVLVEGPPTMMPAILSTPTNLMSQNRCRVVDETVTPGTAHSSEVFWKDHRNLNGYTRIDNRKVRYTLHPGDNAPLIERWSGAAWVTECTYQLQSWSGSVYTVLPLQAFNLLTISPEQVVWEELRYDAAATSFLRVTNRLRRGSDVIESRIVVAAGQGLTGPQSIGLTGLQGSGLALATSADGTGIVVTSSASQLPGFCLLTATSVAAAISGAAAYSGVGVATGAIARIGILAGYQDAVYTGLGTAALYAGRWASYNRMRVAQRLQVS